jgi:acyl carrier protein
MVKMLDTKSKSVIIFNFSIAYKQIPEFSEFFIANDLGTPMAVMVVHDLVELTAGGQELIEETWISLCQAVGADPLQDYLDLEGLMAGIGKVEAKQIIASVSSAEQRQSPDVEVKTDATGDDIQNYMEGLYASTITREDYDEVKFALIHIIFEVTGVLISADDTELEFVEDLNIDSLNAVAILAACEERFEIGISDKDFKQIASVSDAIKLIVKILNAYSVISDSADAYDRGDAAMTVGDVSEGIELLKSSVMVGNLDAGVYLSWTYILLNDFESALELSIGFTERTKSFQNLLKHTTEDHFTLGDSAFSDDAHGDHYNFALAAWLAGDVERANKHLMLAGNTAEPTFLRMIMTGTDISKGQLNQEQVDELVSICEDSLEFYKTIRPEDTHLIKSRPGKTTKEFMTECLVELSRMSK